MKKCRSCGRRIRWVEGNWYHVWWVQDRQYGTQPAGSTECAWRGRPGPVTLHAEPVEVVSVDQGGSDGQSMVC